MNPNYPRPRHARYLNVSQFRVHEPVGMLTPTRTMKVIPKVTSAPSRTVHVQAGTKRARRNAR